MTIYTFLLITQPSVDHITVSKHSTAFVGNVKEITMAFLALVILKGGIGFTSLLFVVILALEKVEEDVLGAVPGFGIEEVKGVVRGRQVAIHAVGHKALPIVHVGGGLPGVVGELNLVAAGTKLGRGCANHGVIGETE